MSEFQFLEPDDGGGIGRLGQYRVLKLLGRGGMGIVFEAEHLLLKQPRALKVILPEWAASAKFRARFLREAKLAAGLDNKHVVHIYDVSDKDAVPFLVMELLSGETLEARLQQLRTFPLREVLRIGREIAEGLTAAHDMGLVHRDIKPSNLWLKERGGHVKILDFGLARPFDGAAVGSLPQTLDLVSGEGEVLGTHGYMPPEQLKGEKIDHRADLFSLGCVLYRLCTGSLPFHLQPAAQMLASILQGPPHPVTLNTDVPRALSDLIISLLSPHPTGRPKSACLVVQVLAAIEPQNPTCLVRSYPLSDDSVFIQQIDELIARSSTIRLIGTGLNLLWRAHIRDLLFRRAKDPCVSVHICLGNPHSPHVQDRLCEETLYGHQPPLGRSGMETTIDALVGQLSTLDKLHPGHGMSITLFEHYPTFATLIFDDDIFVYPYGYRVLGNSSPVFHFRNDKSPESRFFLDNADRVLRDAVPARDVVEANRHVPSEASSWYTAAVRILPPHGTRLYDFATIALGRELHATPPGQMLGEDRHPRLDVREYIGDAGLGGFHLPLTGRLFFANKEAIERVKAQLHFLVKEFKPFLLTGFEIVNPFHDDPSIIALRCQDDSGTVEALHFELVSRVHRSAISSPSRTGATLRRSAAAQSLRGELMRRRYGTTDVLHAYEPHFPLCTKAPADPQKRQAIVEQFRRALRSVPGDLEQSMDRVHLVLKAPGEGEEWTIDPDDFRFGG